MRRLPLALLLLMLAACSGQQAALDAAGDQASRIGDVWRMMLWVCGAMYVLVLAGLGAALWRARRALAGPPVADGAESPNERLMEKALAGWTGLIVAGLVVLALGSFLVDRALARADAANALKVKVTAHQWWWEIEYDAPVAGDRVSTANELHLPAGRPVRVELHSDDVIHSFWIPNLNGKQDLIPGRTNTLMLTPRRAGSYRGECAEFCGLQHAKMALAVTVEEPAAFEAWRRRQLAPAPEPSTPEQARGKAVFQTAACGACHQIQGADDAMGRTGPNLTHMAGRRYVAAGALPYNQGSLAAWIADPQAIKPGAHMPKVPLAPRDLTALVAYLDSLA